MIKIKVSKIYFTIVLSDIFYFILFAKNKIYQIGHYSRINILYGIMKSLRYKIL